LSGPSIQSEILSYQALKAKTVKIPIRGVVYDIPLMDIIDPIKSNPRECYLLDEFSERVAPDSSTRQQIQDAWKSIHTPAPVIITPPPPASFSSSSSSSSEKTDMSDTAFLALVIVKNFDALSIDRLPPTTRVRLAQTLLRSALEWGQFDVSRVETITMLQAICRR